MYTHTHTFSHRTHTLRAHTCAQVYPRDRINRIRVWWIEFNMVITSDENTRALRLCSLEPPLRARNSIRISDGPSVSPTTNRKQRGNVV